MGGTGALVDGLGKLMADEGIEVQLGKTVEKLIVEDKRVQSVALDDGTVMSADLVISNADPAHLYQSMLPTESVHQSAKLKAQYSKKSMGLYVLFFWDRRDLPRRRPSYNLAGPKIQGIVARYFPSQGDFGRFFNLLTSPNSNGPKLRA